MSQCNGVVERGLLMFVVGGVVSLGVIKVFLLSQWRYKKCMIDGF
jgi:hypothetical protein